MFEIYTDASVSNGNAVSTCLVISPDAFLGYTVNQYTDITSSLHGELLGILDGIRYAKKTVLKPDDKAVLYSDSNSAVSLLNSKKTNSAVGADIIQDIYAECSNYNITFEVVKGHQSSHNPNKIVDLTSNTVLRYLMRTEVL